MIRSGVDLIEIARIGESVNRFGRRFLERVYTPGELAGCDSRVESLAARFAAKEAAAKMLGTGIWRHDIGWTDIEVVRDPASGAPSLVFHHAAAAWAQQLGLREWSISLSHDRTHAIAFVVGMGGR